jgi:hypothetical protein
LGVRGGEFFDVARDVTIATDGGIYITGDTTCSANSAFLVKFATDGSVIPVRREQGDSHAWANRGRSSPNNIAAFGPTRFFRRLQYGIGERNWPTTESAPISGVVPTIHVADVERSVEFYRLLGFEIGNCVPPAGPMDWAWLYAPKAADWKRGPNLMLTRGARPIDADAQEVLLYLYGADLKSLRSGLLAKGVDAGEISYPDYLRTANSRCRIRTATR